MIRSIGKVSNFVFKLIYDIAMRALNSVQPVHRKMLQKYKDEVELPEIKERSEFLEHRKNNPMYRQPSYEEIKSHCTNYVKQRRQKLEENINNRIIRIK